MLPHSVGFETKWLLAESSGSPTRDEKRWQQHLIIANVIWASNMLLIHAKN